MRIIVVEPSDDLNLDFHIPDFLVNDFIVKLVLSKSSKYTDCTFTHKQIHTLTKELKRAKKMFGELELVRVESKDGEVVKIIL